MIALSRLHNWRLWVCISVSVRVGFFFFPFKSCCRRRRRCRRCKRKASMRSSFVFHFTFRVTFNANCSLLTVANPSLGKINFRNVGGGEGRASPSAANAGVSIPSTPGPQTSPTPPPLPASRPRKNWSPFYPPGPGGESAPSSSIHAGPDTHHTRRWPWLTCISLLPSQAVGLSQLELFLSPIDVF